MNKFPDHTNLNTELLKAINRLSQLGVEYPTGYYEELLTKYTSGIPYPRILMRIGEPNIRKHQMYSSVLENIGMLLDYGCGTGDDIRALIVDGYPTNMIFGYDIVWDNINIGFDLYRDRQSVQNMFTVSPTLQYNKNTFTYVYSGSVIHTLKKKDAIDDYLTNAFRILKPEGIFFGSTLGTDKNTVFLDEHGPLILLTENELSLNLMKAGFIWVKIIATDSDQPEHHKYRFWFSGIKNSS